MGQASFWFRTFPVAAIVVCIVLLVLLKKVFGRSGPGSNQNTYMWILIAALAAACAVAAWGFKNVKPPKMEGTWK
jgi:phosphatidylserine synthase